MQKRAISVLKFIARCMSSFILIKSARKLIRNYLYNQIVRLCDLRVIKDIKRKIKKNRRVLIFVSIEFNSVLFQRPQHIALQLAKKNNLIFYYSFSNSNSNNGTLFFSKNLYLVHNYDKIINFFNNNVKKEYFIIYSATCNLDFRQIRELKRKGYNIIYSYIDEIAEEISGYTKNILEIFNNLEKIDPILIVASSKKLYTQMSLRFPKEKIVLVPNGVEIENFTKEFKDVPKDMEEIVKNGKPIIGYYGAIATWLDNVLLNRLHEERPNYNFVYIGCDYNGGLHKLNRRENVYFLGPKQYKGLGNYSALFYVCTIPFCEGEIAKSTSPLKLFEYMAARKPVVVTKDLLECYGYEGVLVSENHDDFIKNIDKALELRKDEKIRNKLFEYASQNTWDMRAGLIDKKLTEIENTDKRKQEEK